MEDNTLNPHQKENNPLKKWVIILSILAAIFLATTLYFAFFAKPVLNQEYIKTEVERSHLETELNELLLEHDKIKAAYGDLSEQLSEKDSVIKVNAEEIKKLINSQADYNKIKKQLTRLQNIAKEYVEEMDQLYQENQALKEENIQVKETLAQEREKTATILKDKENLNEKITTAAVLKAYNIKSQAIYTKSKNEEEVVTTKVSRAAQFKVTLMLGENSLIEPGPVNVYCRIAVPESGKVLTPGAADAYTFDYNGEKLQYTAKSTINYTNKAENISLYWNIRPGDKAIKGKYIVEVYTDNYLLGESIFTLE